MIREENYWQAVMSRDSGSDGAFVYGVRSTGIYCRPSCPSRRPRRAQVVFFHVPEAAEEAGFRPCLRCRPRGTGLPEHQVEPVRQEFRSRESVLRALRNGRRLAARSSRGRWRPRSGTGSRP